MKYFNRLFRAVMGKDLPSDFVHIDGRERDEKRKITNTRAKTLRGIGALQNKLAQDELLTHDRTDLDAPVDFVITFFSATGGTIVRVSRPYSNNIVEDPTTSLYIIQDTSNLGEELSKIITMERMKR